MIVTDGCHLRWIQDKVPGYMTPKRYVLRLVYISDEAFTFHISCFEFKHVCSQSIASPSAMPVWKAEKTSKPECAALMK